MFCKLKTKKDSPNQKRILRIKKGFSESKVLDFLLQTLICSQVLSVNHELAFLVSLENEEGCLRKSIGTTWFQPMQDRFAANSTNIQNYDSVSFLDVSFQILSISRKQQVGFQGVYFMCEQAQKNNSRSKSHSKWLTHRLDGVVALSPKIYSPAKISKGGDYR